MIMMDLLLAMSLSILPFIGNLVVALVAIYMATWLRIAIDHREIVSILKQLSGTRVPIQEIRRHSLASDRVPQKMENEGLIRVIPNGAIEESLYEITDKGKNRLLARSRLKP